MTTTETYWRRIGFGRIGFVGACFILGSLCWSVFSNFLGPSRAAALDEKQNVNQEIFANHFSPAEVVSLQVEAMRESLTDPERLKVCYSLSSPRNRKVTGPFAKFAKMVMMPPYDRMATCPNWQVGSATIERDYAAVLVSTVSESGEATAFRFIMHQYSKPPYNGCWLTEAVQVLEQVSTSEECKDCGTSGKGPLLE